SILFVFVWVCSMINIELVAQTPTNETAAEIQPADVSAQADELTKSPTPRFYYDAVHPADADTEALLPEEDAIVYEMIICTFSPKKEGETLIHVISDMPDENNKPNGMEMLFFTTKGESIDVLINFLCKSGMCEVLTRPQIMTHNKQNACVIVGSRDEDGEEYGVTLDIRPEIIEDKFFKTKIELELKNKGPGTSTYIQIPDTLRLSDTSESFVKYILHDVPLSSDGTQSHQVVQVSAVAPISTKLHPTESDVVSISPENETRHHVLNAKSSAYLSDDTGCVIGGLMYKPKPDEEAKEIVICLKARKLVPNK
ncbi:MAG: hypothetical protein ACRC2T_09365, partial [Thermoguttaceae bacterium]